MDLGFAGWKKDVDAYRWVFEHLDGELSRQAIAILDPQEIALRDYMVEFKIPVLWQEMPVERLKMIAGIDGIKGIFANHGRTHETNPRTR